MTEEEKEEMEDIPYRALIGSLLFLAQRTRPDILFSVIALSQFNSNPGYKHWSYLKQLTRYVLTTSHYGLIYHHTEDPQLFMYSDSDWGSDRDTRRSHCGYVTYAGTTPVSWRSVKQKSVALSTTEAEYVALTETIKELLWLNPICEELKLFNVKLGKPTIFCDNQSAIALTKNNIENYLYLNILIYVSILYEKN